MRQGATLRCQSAAGLLLIAREATLRDRRGRVAQAGERALVASSPMLMAIAVLLWAAGLASLWILLFEDGGWAYLVTYAVLQGASLVVARRARQRTVR